MSPAGLDALAVGRPRAPDEKQENKEETEETKEETEESEEVTDGSDSGDSSDTSQSEGDDSHPHWKSMKLKVGQLIIADTNPGFLLARITKLLDVVWVEPVPGSEEEVLAGDIEVHEYDTTSTADPKQAAYFPVYMCTKAGLKKAKGPSGAPTSTRVFWKTPNKKLPSGYTPVLTVKWSESLIMWGMPDEIKFNESGKLKKQTKENL